MIAMAPSHVSLYCSDCEIRDDLDASLVLSPSPLGFGCVCRVRKLSLCSEIVQEQDSEEHKDRVFIRLTDLMLSTIAEDQQQVRKQLEQIQSEGVPAPQVVFRSQLDHDIFAQEEPLSKVQSIASTLPASELDWLVTANSVHLLGALDCLSVRPPRIATLFDIQSAPLYRLGEFEPPKLDISRYIAVSRGGGKSGLYEVRADLGSIVRTFSSRLLVTESIFKQKEHLPDRVMVALTEVEGAKGIRHIISNEPILCHMSPLEKVQGTLFRDFPKYTLREFVPSSQSMRVRLSLMKQLVEAVLDLHSRGVVHLNISLDSIFLSKSEAEWRLYLSPAPSCIAEEPLGLGFKVKGICLAPEQILSEFHGGLSVDPKKIDIWQLGDVLFYFLFGESLFQTNRLSYLFDVLDSPEDLFRNCYTMCQERSRAFHDPVALFLTDLIHPDPSLRPSAGYVLYVIEGALKREIEIFG